MSATPIRANAATLTWGVKESFRHYVEGSGGTVDAGLGAERAEDGTFIFDAAPGPGLKLGADGKLTGQGAFAGEVRFQAHGGMLSVFMADPSIEIGEAGAFLTVYDTPERIRRIPLAKLDVANAVVGLDGALVVPAVMSIEGWQVLGDHYLPMTPLDPVRLKLR
ncbi:HtaA domain-containing protein [Caulobacter sp. KR2-114]|uniref:HtaA domain-containing protein n=1 Tax=Caulobacter sp. KR2-114 TaxID=3400912 RepID=UPI003C0F066B